MQAREGAHGAAYSTASTKEREPSHPHTEALFRNPATSGRLGFPNSRPRVCFL